MTTQMDKEDRKQRRLRRLGTQNPICAACGEAESAVLELHHMAGRKHDDALVIVCANCHRKLSDKQLDHVVSRPTRPNGQLARVEHRLLGLTDLLVITVESLQKLRAHLIERSRRQG